ELRAYVDGDDPRRIDWAATARAGAMQTRVVLEERALVLAVALDASGSMQAGRRASNYELVCGAAREWYGAAHDDDRCARIGARPFYLRDVRGRTGAAACVAWRDDAPDFETTLRLALAVLPRGTRLLVASDFYDLDATLATLRACVARFDVTALFARDPWHADLPLSGFVRFRDLETGVIARAYVDRAARERYRNAVAAREEQVLAALRDAGMRVATIDEASGAEAALARAFHIA
ncbi:MAG: DUF58 domain-containing protein, partial [Candidatus Eremiobacteraeota bacterium]|nr:DUF58 domain-containing protein [Candidatus Eremiobacteraeota bacterium]